MKRYMSNPYGDSVRNQETGSDIPLSGTNVHYLRYLEWLDAGNTPDPVPAPPEPSDEQKLANSDQQMVRAVDWLLQYLVKEGFIPLGDIPGPLKNLYLRRKAQRGA